MSAWIVSEKHILTLAYFYEKLVKKSIDEENLIDMESLKKTARILWSENTKSVNYRYNEKSNTRFSKVETVLPKMDCEMPELYKLIMCWEYQTCEHPNHAKSKAWMMMQKLKTVMLDNIIRNRNPFAMEYELASWGMY